jgi:serine/threonine protein kinase
MSSSAFPVFDRAGKYRLGPKLGEGGMAEVYRGWTVGHDGVERLVAIKRILSGQLDATPHMRELFVNEARLAARLHHANIVQMIDFDQDPEGRLFQVMEFVDGVDLERLVATVPTAGLLPVPVSCYVIGQVLRALDYAYNGAHPDTGRQLAIVHRDATPSNVLLSWAGDVKLTDLGVAKAVLATQATMSGRLTGKPAYMSPEQVHGAPLDGRSDVFAAGVMLWELLTGHRLFVGDSIASTIAQVLQYAQYTRRLEPPHVLNPSVPPSLSTVVAHLLAPERDQRPADAGAAYALLRECADIRIGDATDLAEALAARFPGRAPQRPGRRSSAPVAVERGPATREQMRAPTSSLRPEITPIAGQIAQPRAPRGAKVGLVVAIGLLGAAGIVAAVLVASDGARATPTGAAVPSAAGRPAPQAPATPVVAPPTPSAPAVQASTDGGTEVAGVTAPADAGASRVGAEPGAAPTEKKPRRPRRPARAQIREVQLGSQ